MPKINKDYSLCVIFIVLGCSMPIKNFPTWPSVDFSIVSKTKEGAQGPFLLEHLLSWGWICNTYHGNHQRLEAMKDINAEGTDEVKEVQQPMKSLKARDCEETGEANELKRELKELKELKASFKLKCIAILCVIVCFIAFIATKFM